MLILVMAALFNCADARVYCEDNHATPYLYLGFACPVNCNNVVEAVKRLKLLDEQSTHHNSVKSRRYEDDDIRTLYVTCERIFKNKMAADELQTELLVYHNCKLFSQKGFSFRKLMDLNMTKCFRRSNQQQFLEVFTMILNKHAHGMYKFTKEMSSLILQNVIDDEEALRNNKLDIKKLLHFLKKALTKHKKIAHSENITLKSKHCLMLNMPGCYCTTGFVENSGQCVQPTDCLTDSIYLKYIPRVHLL